MSDEGGKPRRRDEPPVPDWLTQSFVGPGEAEMMAVEEGLEAAGWSPKHRAGEVTAAVPRRRYIYRSSEWTRVSPRVYRCRVTVASAAGEFSGEAEGPAVPGVRAEIAARGALAALNHAEDGHVALALKGARVLRIFEGPIVVVGVYGMNSSTTPLVGACLVENSVEQSAIFATLQAADRWLAWQARQSSK